MNSKNGGNNVMSNLSIFESLRPLISWTNDEVVGILKMNSNDLIRIYETIYETYKNTNNFEYLKKLIVITNVMCGFDDETRNCNHNIKFYLLKNLYEEKDKLDNIPIIFKSILVQNLLNLIYVVGDYKYFTLIQNEIELFIQKLLSNKYRNSTDKNISVIFGYIVTIISNYNKILSNIGQVSNSKITYNRIISLLKNVKTLGKESNLRYLLFIGIDNLNNYIEEFRIQKQLIGKQDKQLQKIIENMRLIIGEKLNQFSSNYLFELLIQLIDFKIDVINNKLIDEKQFINLRNEFQYLKIGKEYYLDLLFYYVLYNYNKSFKLGEKSKLRKLIEKEAIDSLGNILDEAKQSNNTNLQIQVLLKTIEIHSDKQQKLSSFYEAWGLAVSNSGGGFVKSNFVKSLLFSLRQNFVLSDFVQDENYDIGVIDINEKIHDLALISIVGNSYSYQKQNQLIQNLETIIEMNQSPTENTNSININVSGVSSLSMYQKEKITSIFNELVLLFGKFKLILMNNRSKQRLFNLEFDDKDQDIIKELNINRLENSFCKLQIPLKILKEGFSSTYLYGKKYNNENNDYVLFLDGGSGTDSEFETKKLDKIDKLVEKALNIYLGN